MSAKETKPTGELPWPNEHLRSFLGATVRTGTSISKLRGLQHILRLIWSLVCEEWWDLHIERFPQVCIGRDRLIPELQVWTRRPRSEYNYEEHAYPVERTLCSGCPVAVIARDLEFPPFTSVPERTFSDQISNHLCVNMMPFDLYEINSLPSCCQQYWPLIHQCCRLISQTSCTAYLTIDERPVEVGESQRRRGLHVESPGLRIRMAHKNVVSVSLFRPTHGIYLGWNTGGVEG